MVTFLNLTPHALTVQGLGTLPPSGILPRCATVRTDAPAIGGIRVIDQSMGEVIGLPEPVEGTYLIVSGMVLGALNGSRVDVVAPDTGPDAIRESGQITAVRGFVR